MILQDKTKEKWHVQPYHMNGLNWTVVPDDPQRDNIVIMTGFMPNWWTEEYGITFRRDFHTDPVVHQATLAKMAGILNERFGDIPNFFYSPFDYEKTYPMERLFGDPMIPALFNAEVSCDEEMGHPVISHYERLTEGNVLQLIVPDFKSHPVMKEIFNHRTHAPLPVVGELGYEGVINVAYQLRGEDLFIDLLENPNASDHLFKIVAETITGMVDHVRQWADPKGTRPSCFVASNCLMCMVSGIDYRKHLMKYDQQFYEHFDLFGVHTCNWSIDHYLDELAEIGDLAYLDMGADSDLEKVHKLFSDLTPSVFYHPEKLKYSTPAQVSKDVTELGKRIGRGYILFCDLERGNIDNSIRAAYEAAARL